MWARDATDSTLGICGETECGKQTAGSAASLRLRGSLFGMLSRVHVGVTFTGYDTFPSKRQITDVLRPRSSLVKGYRSQLRRYVWPLSGLFFSSTIGFQVMLVGENKQFQVHLLHFRS